MGCSPSPRKHCLELNVVVRVLPQTGWVPFLSLSGPLVGHGMWVERRTGPVHGARKIGSGPRCGPGRLQMRQPEISTWTLTCLTQAGEGCRLIFEFGSFAGPAAQCTLAGPGPASQSCLVPWLGPGPKTIKPGLKPKMKPVHKNCETSQNQ